LKSIDFSKTAILFMDFVNDTVHPEGKFAAMGVAAHLEQTRAIENAEKALVAARAKGLPVIHVRVAFRPGHPELNGDVPFWAGVIQGEALVEGTWGAEFLHAMAPVENEVVIIKRGVSAFNDTELARYLTFKGIKTLVLAGVATNWVVEATTRDAADLGYSLFVLQDCCGSFNEELHSFSVQNILGSLATLTTANEFATAL
jgi:nicotinamidase-related amidase